MSQTETNNTRNPSRNAFVPVLPSRIVRILVRPLTRVLNPIIVKLAGKRHFAMAAQIRHHGRHSGQAYLTPVTARMAGDTIWIALTFGNQSDWSRNVRAAGGCSMRIGGLDYEADTPRFVDRDDAGPELKKVFKPVERAMFRLLGIKQFLCLRAVTTPEGHQ